MLLKHGFDIVAVSESWLRESTTDLYDIDEWPIKARVALKSLW